VTAHKPVAFDQLTLAALRARAMIACMTSSGRRRAAAPPPLFPRTYRLERKVLLGLYAYALFGAAAGALLIASAAGSSTVAWTVTTTVLGISCMLCAGYIALGAARTRLVLTYDELSVHHLMHVQRIRRGDVAQYRLFRCNTGSIVIGAGKSYRDIILVPETAAMDRYFVEWFGEPLQIMVYRLSNFQQFLELCFPHDFPVENFAQVASADTLGKYLTGLALFVGISELFIPGPFAPVLMATLALPPLLLVAAARSDGALGFGDRLDCVRPSLAVALSVPSLVLAYRAFKDFEVLDWLPALGCGTGLAVVLVCAMALADRSFRQEAVGLALLTLLMLGYGYGAVITANTLLDLSPPSVIAAKVLGKDVHRARKGGRLCTVDLAPTHGRIEEHRVFCSLYERISIGDQVEIEIRHGALGIRWVQVREGGRATQRSALAADG
jgi:hypothetical protein